VFKFIQAFVEKFCNDGGGNVFNMWCAIEIKFLLIKYSYDLCLDAQHEHITIWLFGKNIANLEQSRPLPRSPQKPSEPVDPLDIPF
jgi:hypothetical protein